MAVVNLFDCCLTEMVLFWRSITKVTNNYIVMSVDLFDCYLIGRGFPGFHQPVCQKNIEGRCSYRQTNQTVGRRDGAGIGRCHASMSFDDTNFLLRMKLNCPLRHSRAGGR